MAIKYSSLAGTPAPFPGAGTVAAQAYSALPWYSTTLAAGTYYLYATAKGGSSTWKTGTTYNPNYIYNGTGGVSGGQGAYHSYHAYNSNSRGQAIPSGTPAVFKTTTSETVYFGTSFDVVSDLSYGSGMGGSGAGFSGYSNIDNYMSANSTGDYVWSAASNRDQSGRLYYAIHTIPGPGAHTYYSTSQTSFTHYAINGNTGEGTITAGGYMGSYHWAHFDTSLHARSTDGISWTVFTVTGLSDVTYDMCKGTSYYVMITQATGSTAHLASSTDGVTWSTRTANTGNVALYSVTFGNGTYVATGNAGVILSSTDSITWTSRTAPQSTYRYRRVMYNATAGKFLAIQDNAATSTNAAISTDGITWTGVGIFTSPVGTTIANGNAMQNNVSLIAGCANNSSLVYNGYFVLRIGPVLTISSNGTTWGTLNMMAHGGGQGPLYNSPTYGLCTTVNRQNPDDYSGVAIAYAQPATYTIYNSTVS